MKLFGNWRFTNEKPHIESETISKLQKQLTAEHQYRQKQTAEAEKREESLKIELIAVKKAEAERLKNQRVSDQAIALQHLTVAERYESSYDLAKGARKSQLKAIIDRRLEMAANLGFRVKGSITKTIQALS